MVELGFGGRFGPVAEPGSSGVSISASFFASNAGGRRARLARAELHRTGARLRQVLYETPCSSLASRPGAGPCRFWLGIGVGWSQCPCFLSVAGFPSVPFWRTIPA